MKRRSLILGTGASILAGPLPGRSAAPVAVREDIATLAQQPGRLAKLAGAIGEMQRRSAADAADPGGWTANAAAHVAVCSAVANADPAQVHGCWWFLPWHRAFLAVTEWKLRAIAGDPSLALPYWNWSTDRSLPAPFTQPGSPLAAAVRHTPDRGLRAVEADHLAHDPALAALGVAAFGAPTFQAWTPEHIPLAFGGIAKPNDAGWHGRSRFELSPHNPIHNYAGGEAADGSLGDMTELATAARDPVFYAHHGNLDRLWETWRADPARRATEPADPAFLDKPFVYPWLDGTPITITVREALDTRRLGYVYDTLSVFRDGAVPPPDGALAQEPLALARLAVPAIGRGERASLCIRNVVQGARPVSVEITLRGDDNRESPISIGVFATGRQHSPPQFPDTELRYDVTAALAGLAARSVTVAVLPLPLGPRPSPAFAYDDMRILLVS